MNRNIIYFFNPISGTKGKDKLLQLIDEKTRLHKITYQILPTNAAGNYDFLKEKINAEQITDIVVCGGDGTVSQIAAALIDEPVNIGIIPMGSGNGLAYSAKIPNQIDKALDIVFNGTPSYIDSFFINTTFSCMLCGLGFDAQVAHDFAKQSKRGLITYIKQTMLNILSAKTYHFEIVNKGEKCTVEAYFISIANSNQFGNQFTIAPKASLCDGLLDIVVVKKMSKLKLIWALFNQFKNGKIADYTDASFNKNDILYFQTARLVINNPQLAPLHIDGDPAATGAKFSIQIIPRAFRLIQP
jgi:YegS/Rv2252/BmrU family lipid kinase